MDPKKSKKKKDEGRCPFTNGDIINAFTEEVHLFMHIHLRGYDRTGEGLSKDAEFYDKYGAPVTRDESWVDGYHAIERELAQHFNRCYDRTKEFPLIAGMAGGAHLYKPVGHDNEPWNWTGWVPRRQVWCSNNRHHNNRHFVNIRGNEIQNNLWDYHPYQEREGAEFHDDSYEQITALDDFEDRGYWLKGEPWGRYIHIIGLKSHIKVDGFWVRYNYIVHPLAYRKVINDVPDNSVDGMQWSILNIKYEKQDPHFNDPEKWGTDVHGLEIYNDFTYYHSWQPKNEVLDINNGTVMNYYNDPELKRYIYWFDTYPLEYGEFLLDTAFERGVYLQVLAANDAFYTRNLLPKSQKKEPGLRQGHKRSKRVLLSDPKGNMIKRNLIATLQPAGKYSTKMKKTEAMAKNVDRRMREVADFLKTRPYGADTAFGHTTLIDPKRRLRQLMEKNNLDDTEMLTMNWLIEARFFAHTGVFDLFNYEDRQIPVEILNQENREQLCYQMTDKMELIFDFPVTKENKADLLWRYSLEYIKNNGTFETVHGYFNMDPHHPTRLNLSESYDKYKFKWIQFTAFKDENPQRRAWFNAIRGLAFGDPKPNEAPPERRHKVVKTKERKIYHPDEIVEVYEDGEFLPFTCASNKLEFFFPQCTRREEDNIYVYDMQVCAPQPEDNELTKNSARDPKTGKFLLPDRILQNIHGYFVLNDQFPTKLNLSYSWDPKTVRDEKVYFYCIDTETGQPTLDFPTPTSIMPDGYEL